MKATLHTKIAPNWDEANKIIAELAGRGIESHALQHGFEVTINWAELKSSYQETSTVLASLRLLQDKIEDGSLGNERKLPHFDDVEPLTSEQIDELCEQLNSL